MRPALTEWAATSPAMDVGRVVVLAVDAVVVHLLQ